MAEASERTGKRNAVQIDCAICSVKVFIVLRYSEDSNLEGSDCKHCIKDLMICPNCSNANADAAHFCFDCGAALTDVATQSSSRSAPQRTLVDAAADSLLNIIIADRYRIDAKLGAGGMGTVYRATRLMIGDEVAVKILHRDAADPHAAARFRREAQAAARLKHPNAVTIHDFGVTPDGLQYLVMELVDGRSVRQIIKQEGPLTPSTAAEIVAQVCSALDVAHAHHIVHRDLKPDNIIVNITVNGLRVKVLDFGIAKLRDDTAGNLTQTGSILGTPHYMSPEQCLGEELDGRSDIYSLGVVLFEMLTGIVPFNSPTPSAVVVQQVTQAPPALRSINASISPMVEAVVLKALQKQRDARPRTAGAFAAELTRALQRSVVPGTQQTLTTPHYDSRAVPTVILTEAAAGPRLTEPVLSTVTSDSPSARRSHGSRLLLLTIPIMLVLLLIGGAVALFLFQRRPVPEPSQPSPTPAPSESQPGSTSEIRITATASSVRAPIPTANYKASNAADGRLNTAWIEGAEGPGIGEWIRFDFDRQVELRGLTIAPGYFKSPDIWAQNNRLAAVSLQFSDGTVQRSRFPDRMEQQTLSFGSRKTSWVKILVDEIYFGKDPDTAIGEVSFDFGPSQAASSHAGKD